MAVVAGWVAEDNAEGLEMAMRPGDAPEPNASGSCAHLAFFGFCSEAGMRLLVEILRRTFFPALLQAAVVSDMRFEGILSVCRDSTRAERLLALFKMHIGVVNLDTYMSDSMAACLQRVVAATACSAGNFFEPTNLPLRSDLLAHQHAATLSVARPPTLLNVVLLVHGSRHVWFRGPVAMYEASENTFLHTHSVMYTPSHMLHAPSAPPHTSAHEP
jgi:hypothetical protein